MNTEYLIRRLVELGDLAGNKDIDISISTYNKGKKLTIRFQNKDKAISIAFTRGELKVCDPDYIKYQLDKTLLKIKETE